MQALQNSEFKVTLRNSDANNIFADLYFSKNPENWRTVERTHRGVHTVELKAWDRFQQVVLKKSVFRDQIKFSGRICNGIGVLQEYEIEPEDAKQFFARVSHQQEQWMKYRGAIGAHEPLGTESIAKYVTDLMLYRCPTDWQCVAANADKRTNGTPRVMTVIGHDSGRRVALRKTITSGGENMYEGVLSGESSSEINPDDAKLFFEQVIKHGKQAMKAELQAIVQNDLSNLISQIPADKWIVSKRWSRPSEDGEHIGYLVMTEGSIAEGRNTMRVNIKAEIELSPSKQKLRIGLERNGHTAVERLEGDQRDQFLDLLCRVCQLKPFHRMATDLNEKTETMA